jgi:Tfp pilus assembly PilM family ATPase/Tfp pilus assembly protein PilN
MQQRLRKCLGIDIGASSVKIVELAADKTGVKVLGMYRAELDLPPGPLDASRLQAAAAAAKSLISQNKLSTRQAVYCVPGQSVFIRRIRFPRTSEERLHRIVAYEARQQIPFPLENSLMEYQVFDYGDVREVEVLLVAIRRDLVVEFMKAVSVVGVKPLRISVSSLALFNYHVFDATPYQELLDVLEADRRGEAAPSEKEVVTPGKGPKKKGFAFPKFAFGKKKKLNVEDVANALPPEENPDEILPEYLPDLPMDTYEEVKAYINLGAATFDLAISRHGRRKMLGFARSVNWAGNELVRTLTDKLKLSSSHEAEDIKRNRAIAVIPGREDEANVAGIDPAASEFVAQWADRMILEIRRSFDFYIAQPDGMAVDTMVLSGGQAQQRNLAPYIEEKLGIPVDVRVAPENAALTFSNASPPEDFVAYIVSLGLGLTGLGLGQLTVDFLPTEMKTIREFKGKKLELALMALAILLMLGLSTMMGTQEIGNRQKWLTDNQSKIETANSTKASLDKVRGERNAVNDKVTAIGQALNDRTYWLEFLGMMQSVKPSSILITRIEMRPDGVVEIYGETAESYGSIAAFSNDLQSQKAWVKQAEITTPPTEAYSALIGGPVKKFGLTVRTHWKQTRLAPARRTMAPGVFTPTPTPVGTVPPSIGPEAVDVI